MNRFLAAILIMLAGAASADTVGPDVSFTWEPILPTVGDLVEFKITNVPGPIDIAQWNFGEPGCAGYGEFYTCTPLYTDCITQETRFASGGEKTVSLTLVSGGSVYPTIERTVAVQNQGVCENGIDCTYLVNSTFATFSSDGGSNSFNVTASHDVCFFRVTSTEPWITIDSEGFGFGSGTVFYSVARNTGDSRAGAIQAGNRTHVVSQGRDLSRLFSDGFETGDTGAWSSLVP